MDDDAPVDAEALAHVAVLNDPQLVACFQASRRALYDRGEMIQATSEAGRKLHMVRRACLTRMKERGLR